MKGVQSIKKKETESGKAIKRVIKKNVKSLKDALEEWGNSYSEPKAKLKFKCPVCGCTEYEGMYGNSTLVPLGSKMYPIAYSCKGCSVVFTDPEKFSKRKK